MADLSGCLPRVVDLDEQIACIKREIRLRRSVYPHWVRRGRMRQGAADYEITALEAVLTTLQYMKGNTR